MSPYDPDIHHRRSIRLPGRDYSAIGAYFVTICVNHRLLLFGDVVDAQMQRNAAGQMIEHWWLELANKYERVTTDAYIVMPNHVHGIIMINTEEGAHTGASLQLGPKSGRMMPAVETTESPLYSMIQWFKTMTTNEYIRRVKSDGWKRFSGKLWQRNYHEHIIRHDESLGKIRDYIANNPSQWALDPENSEVKSQPPKDSDDSEPWRV